MTVPYQRRRDPQPVSQGWELAAAAVGGALLLVGLAALTGLGAASSLFGGGWVWPHGSQTIGHVLGGILTGHPGRGFDPAHRRLVASSGVTYAGIALAEAVIIALATAVGVLIARYRRPGDARGGMASRGEAQQVLGIGTLRSARQIIRPDLFPPPGRSHRSRSRTKE